MYTIDENNTITIVKKDTAYFSISLDNYELMNGDILTFTVAREKESQNPLIQKRITEFDEGLAVIFLDTEDTNLDKGSYYYDIQLNTHDGLVDTIVGPAKFKIIEGVTY